jgi:hypothetical protein
VWKRKRKRKRNERKRKGGVEREESMLMEEGRVPVTVRGPEGTVDAEWSPFC